MPITLPDYYDTPLLTGLCSHGSQENCECKSIATYAIEAERRARRTTYWICLATRGVPAFLIAVLAYAAVLAVLQKPWYGVDFWLVPVGVALLAAWIYGALRNSRLRELQREIRFRRLVNLVQSQQSSQPTVLQGWESYANKTTPLIQEFLRNLNDLRADNLTHQEELGRLWKMMRYLQEQDLARFNETLDQPASVEA